MIEALVSSYEGLQAYVRELDDEQSWAPTACTGWAVRDLVAHCLGDAQRALVALHTPADRSPDRDGATYWTDWAPDPVGAAAGRRYVRVLASMFLELDALRGLYLETSAAVVRAASAAQPDAVVATQGHALRVDDLLRTLAVEATVHHLDLPGGAPSPGGLAEVRRTLDQLLRRPVPVDWSDVEYARAATGRRTLTAAERELLGADAGRFPLFS